MSKTKYTPAYDMIAELDNYDSGAGSDNAQELCDVAEALGLPNEAYTSEQLRDAIADPAALWQLKRGIRGE